MRCKLLGLFSSLVFVALGSSLMAASENGSAGDMPAYYDGQLFTINFKELPPGGEDANLQHNGSINFIFMSDNGLPGGQPFVSVLDAIQGDGFNPLWQEVQITFNPGQTPFQLTSDDQIADAAEAGIISLTATGELYRCSVVGQKK
ncbi:MAG TPA: hypothetical protein VKM56_11620 [Verrucomicrobiae bacterium]|nr:hypothetical protein [Verrucomicrobiae bacterium]